MGEIAGWIIAIGLGAIWFGGCIFMFRFGLVEGMPAMSGVGVAVAAIGIGVCALCYTESYPPKGVEIITLRGDRWACTDSRQETTTTYVKSGSVMVPITTTRKICTQWNERS